MNIMNKLALIMQISHTSFQEKLARGMRPVKAAIQLGADPVLAEVLAGLKVTFTKEGINEVYADPSLRSCMLKQDVGTFYEYNDIGVVYGNNFRCLINKDGILARKAYGCKGDFILAILTEKGIFQAGDLFPVETVEYMTKENQRIGYNKVTTVIKDFDPDLTPIRFFNLRDVLQVFGKTKSFEVVSEDTVFVEGEEEPEGEMNYFYNLTSDTVKEDGTREFTFTYNVFRQIDVPALKQRLVVRRPPLRHFVPFLDDIMGYPYEGYNTIGHDPDAIHMLDDFEEPDVEEIIASGIDNMFATNPPPYVSPVEEDDDLPF